MIEPNFNLMMWIIFIIFSLKAVGQIVAGAIGQKKETKYDGGDVVAGIITLILMTIIAFS